MSAVLGLAIYDCASAPRLLAQPRAEQAEARSFSLLPAPLLGRDGEASLGLSAAGHF